MYNNPWLWIPRYEEEGKKEEGTPKTYTEAEFKAALEAEQQKQLKATRGVAEELESLRTRAKLTEEERNNLDKQIENLKLQTQTEKEKLSDQLEKVNRKYKTDVETLTNEAKGWQQKFTTSTIARAITDAAVENKAFSTKQIYSLLEKDARLEALKDEDGKDTGNFEVRIKLSAKDKNGKAIILDLTPSEAVKKLSENEEHMNLFKGDGTGGIGRNSRPSIPLDMKAILSDSAKYREARNKGQLNDALGTDVSKKDNK